MATIGWIIFAGVTHFHARQAFDFPPGAFTLSRDFFHGLGGAMLIAAYDYWGYYNVCFLGDEIENPGKNIPRALLLSIAGVACIYLVMNISILGVVPWRELAQPGAANGKLYVVSLFMQRIYGRGAGGVVSALVMWTAFASVFSLMLGYSRVPYAAAVDGNYFRAFARVHPRYQFPYVSLLALAGVAALFCFSAAGGFDCGAGGDSDPPAISGAEHRGDRAAHTPSGDGAAVSHVALSGAGIVGVGEFYFYPGIAQRFSPRDTVCGGDIGGWNGGVWRASVAAEGVAVWGRGEAGGWLGEFCDP